MEIVSWNVNGIRSVVRKGFFGWLEKESPDILSLQETKIDEDRLTFDLLCPNGYKAYFNSAIRPGYSGVAIFSKNEPLSINKIFGMKRFDDEGRLLELKYKDFDLLNLYIPNGARDKRDMDYKLEVYAKLFKHLKKKGNKKTILVGDFNIAHQEIDLARPKQNINNTMFTYAERVQVDKLLGMGYIDSYRIFEKSGGHYSWWAYMHDARTKNIG